MSRPPSARCLFCGGDASTPNHLLTCDGRQGAIDATLDLPRVADVRIWRDAAMDQVTRHAVVASPTFTDDAMAFVTRYLAQHGPTSGEELTVACKRAGIVPHDDRAFGSVYMQLVRRHVIAKMGQTTRRRGHGTAGGNIWGLLVTSRHE